ncbi:MAG: glutamine synthetase beta-grasp domain-containing protein [Prevotellaceae bacterium]|jgi:glutamine synthetase|nr:glutamine synthetase beta-grasp domain-containing protein [Prevotellaceae bacterium]
MSKSKLEYIWLDGSQPTQALRSKTRIVENFSGKLDDCPMWSFDGSSTYLLAGNISDLLLKPVFICPDPARKHNAYLVMCEVLNPDGTPHPSNARATIDSDDDDFWFGYEQEYFLYDPCTNMPLGFPVGGQPEPQGPYYCGVGAKYAFGRNIVEEHFDLCIEAGLNIEGINAEVAPGQWEFQIFSKGAKLAGDEIWVARYLLERVAEKYGIIVELHPKPLGRDADWNGSGMHANFSNGKMRSCGDKKVFDEICMEFGKHVAEHIAVYGAYNDQRLIGKHETASINDFSWGVSNRGASIRIPVGTVDDGWCGRLEDRRPASNSDPYKVGSIIVQSVKASGHF